MKPTKLDQLLLETRSVKDGIRRYRRQVQRRPAETPPGFAFLRQHLEPLAAAIEIEQSELSSGPGRPALRQETFKTLPAEILALITLRTMLTAVCTRGSDATVTSIAKQIGELCRVECSYHQSIQTTPQWLARNLARKYRGVVPDECLLQGTHDVEDVNVGASLIGLVVDMKPYPFRVGFRPHRSGRPGYERALTLKLSWATETWFNAADADVEGLTPIRLPMIVVPRAWKNLSSGGYLASPRMAMVKRLDTATEKQLQAADLTTVYRAINALQNTAWAINEEIYALMRQAWKQRLDVGNLIIPLPDKPAPLPSDASEQRQKAQKVKWRRWFNKKEGAISTATMLKMRLTYCRLLKKFPALYLPYQLDRRGRAYPVPQIFSSSGGRRRASPDQVCSL